jgi:drug/metabolite transporter (DMT)-like permease
MTPLVLALWLLVELLDTAGQLVFKTAANHGGEGDGWAHWRHMLARPWIWLGGACYVFEFLAWTAFLSLIPLGRGILLGSINIVAIMIAGRLLFGERLTRLRVIGILLVTLGVAIVGIGT